MQTEIRIALSEKQSIFDRTVDRVENTLYGGAKGGGKSHGLREIMLKRRIQIPGSKGVIFRKTWPEVRDNHLYPLLDKFDILKTRYIGKDKVIKFENGSELLFRYCENEKDLKKHQGQEYHDLGIEEAGEWPEDWFDYLKGSNRSAKLGITPRCLLTGNPGGIGHKWLKRLFIDRQYHSNENPDNYAFTPARVWDNPVLMKNDPGYIDRLRANKNPDLVKAFLEGSWDIIAGQFFDMVSRETHFVEPFEIPDHWRRVGMFDWGYNHPSAFYLMAVDNDGNCYVYYEYVLARQTAEQIGFALAEHPDIKSGRISSVPAGHDCWVKHGGGPCVADKVFDGSGGKIVLHKANIDRVAGAQQVRDYLVVREHGPLLRIFKTCPILFDCLTRMTHDPKRPEDVLKVDAADGDPMTGDDPYDALRHGLMEAPERAVEPEPKPRRRYFQDKPSSGWTTV